ncbi:response regulator, partial [Roseateles sp. GG27B]
MIDESEDDALAVAFELGRGMRDIETRWAGDGQGMDTLIAQWQPHLLLTDVYLPRSEFLAELARIRAAWPMLPVVVVSGLVGEEAVAHLIKAGANDFVAKSGASRLPTVAKRELRD